MFLAVPTYKLAIPPCDSHRWFEVLVIQAVESLYLPSHLIGIPETIPNIITCNGRRQRIRSQFQDILYQHIFKSCYGIVNGFVQQYIVMHTAAHFKSCYGIEIGFVMQYIVMHTAAHF